MTGRKFADCALACGMYVPNGPSCQSHTRANDGLPTSNQHHYSSDMTSSFSSSHGYLKDVSHFFSSRQSPSSRQLHIASLAGTFDLRRQAPLRGLVVGWVLVAVVGLVSGDRVDGGMRLRWVRHGEEVGKAGSSDS